MAAVHTRFQPSLVYKLTKVEYICPWKGMALAHTTSLLINSLCGSELEYQRQPEVPDRRACFVPDCFPSEREGLGAQQNS